jgi:hypothetical protein
MQTDKINGNAVPRPIGSQQADARAMHRYLYEVMEQLRFALADLDRRIAELETPKKSTRESGGAG